MFSNFRKSEDGSVYWGGWARMAQPILQFGVVEVAKPNIGKSVFMRNLFYSILYFKNFINSSLRH